ncbi:zinc finger protein [Macleaya cordata]|uniref:Zinc finger protein n=1 Tax=Macleaya cordata TaxID=56857 RepID=A0A200QYE1_MACCD|nr:zinc finger protein [Macleaya cordata]
MKIQCDVCEKAEAMVLCCADEAALCYSCDEKEKAGYFFCLEDRALLCRHCDVSIHTATHSSHQRFLLTGVKFDDFQQHQQQHHHNNINRKSSNFSYLNSSTPLNANASSSVDLSPTNMNIDLDIQPHWPSDEIAATTSSDFDHCYEFSPSELGSSTISSQ